MWVTAPISSNSFFQDRALFDVELDEGMITTPASRIFERVLRLVGSLPEPGLQRAAFADRKEPAPFPAKANRTSGRLPRQPMPKRVGSSLVKAMSSMERRGTKPDFCRRADGFEAAQHPDEHHHNARRWEWHRCGAGGHALAESGSLPSQRTKRFPTASSRKAQVRGAAQRLDLIAARQDPLRNR